MFVRRSSSHSAVVPSPSDIAEASVSAATPDAEEARRAVMLQDVMEGLSMPQKELSPKYLYDTRGSEIFEEITRLEEYYPTRREQALLERTMPTWVGELRPRSFVELGAGSARKSRVVLDAMEAVAPGCLYVPVDVSAEFLHETAARLRAEYDGLRVEPAVADMTGPMALPDDPPEPTWYGLLGSTIGNFDESQAASILRRIARRLRETDRFLLGVDRAPGPHKTTERLERAYNDEAGVTAAFNLNVLRVLNRELGADFDLGAYEHRAFYDPGEARIEIHLVARSDQEVTIPGGGAIRLGAGESIRTELSHKYDRSRVDRMFAAAGMTVDRWAEDDDGYFALVLGRPAAPAG